LDWNRRIGDCDYYRIYKRREKWLVTNAEAFLTVNTLLIVVFMCGRYHNLMHPLGGFAPDVAEETLHIA